MSWLHFGQRLKPGTFRFRWLLFPVFLLLLLNSCGGESDERAKQKLEAILSDDLKTILEGVDPESLIDNPCYKLVSYKTYKEGKYSKRAVAHFYFLKDVKVKIVRKYRYHCVHRMWDRYFNEYSFLADSSAVDMVQKK